MIERRRPSAVVPLRRVPAKKITAAALLSIALIGLAGCVSPEELRAEDEATCTGYGFQRGTTDFAKCLQRENLAREAYPVMPYPYPYPYGFYGPFGPYIP